MNREDFTKNASGQLVITPTGYLAFVPAPLPPQLEWTDDLLSLLSKADRSLAQ